MEFYPTQQVICYKWFCKVADSAVYKLFIILVKTKNSGLF